jgi:hypothetical protein
MPLLMLSFIGSPATAGVVGFVDIWFAIVLLPPAGMAADRGRMGACSRVGVTPDEPRATVLVALLITLLLGCSPLIELFVLTLAVGASSALFLAASTARCIMSRPSLTTGFDCLQLSNRNEISYPLGDIIEPVTCGDADFGGFVVPFRLLSLPAGSSR